MNLSLGRIISPVSNRGFAHTFVTRLQSTAGTSSGSTTSPEIQIPSRIERGPTDILRAIEKTINRDPTAAHYKYHDDPYLIPYSQNAKRNYALAQEAGRKSAMWIREKHADLFQHRVADPAIESFLPKAVYTKKEEVNEEILRKSIEDAQVTDALKIYKLMEESVSLETKQALLELLCYYNNDEPSSDDLPEERWFKHVDRTPRWNNSPDIEALFASLKDQDKPLATKAYNAMICGTAKYIKSDRAWALFEEAEKKDITLYTTTYNLLIKIIPILKHDSKEYQELLEELLRKMVTCNVEPNIETLSAALKVSAGIGNTRTAIQLCQSLLAEFRSLGIKPSLTSYTHMLTIYYKKGGSHSPALLSDILRELEGKELVMYEKTDSYFFLTAIEVAASILEDPELGDKIHKLLLTGDNYNFIGNGYSENVYYRYFCLLHVKNNSLEDFMELYYNIIIPHVYTPEPQVMEAVLSAVEANDPEISAPILPRLWTHMVQFDHLDRKNLVAKALNIMRTHCKPKKDSPLNKMFADASWTVWTYIKQQQERRIQKITWDGPILGDIAVLNSRAGDFEKTSVVLSFLFNEQGSIVGPLQPAQIKELLEACIFGCHTSAAVDLVHYCSDVGVEETPSMAFSVWRNLPLNEWQENRLKSLVDPDIFKIKSEDSQ